jgi:RNA polymerase sigma-70 factor (ECF subfamily)
LNSKRALDLYERARQRWPGVEVAAEHFSQALAANDDAADGIHTDDLYLVLACLNGQPEAIAVFERDVLATVRPAVERSCGTAAAVDDALQTTREKLLLGPPPAAPKLTQYTGRGSLAAWVRVVAVREALQAARKTKREKSHDDFAFLDGMTGTTAASVELSVLRKRYADSFRTAMEEALRRLTPEQRMLLRFHAKDGLTIDQLAPMLGVHRATAARRLEKARADALEHARDILTERHNLSDSETRSLFRALASEVDFSIGRALADEAAP